MAETIIEEFSSTTDWTNLSGSIAASSGQGAGGSAGLNFGYITAGSWGPDVFIGMTVAAVPADNDSVFICARLSNLPAANGYMVSVVKSSGIDTMYVRRLTGGAAFTVGSWTQEIAAGNRIGIDCTGSTISAYADTGSGWFLVGSVTDGNHSGAGTIGLGIDNTVARVDDIVQVTADATKRLLLMGVG